MQHRVGPELEKRELDRPPVAEIGAAPSEWPAGESAWATTDREHLMARANLRNGLAPEQAVRTRDGNPH
jgi:hypothetical protein